MAGLRDVLAAQGVVPVSGSEPVTVPGLSTLQSMGVWISGGLEAETVPGLAVLQAQGVWISGGQEAETVPGLSLLQASGIWISGGETGEIIIEEPREKQGGNRWLIEQARQQAQMLSPRDEEEIMIVVRTVLECIQWRH